MAERVNRRLPNRSGGHLTDLVLLVVANVMFGAQYPATKTAVSTMGPVLLSILTFGLAAICLLPFLLKENRDHPEQLSPRSLFLGRNFFPFFMATALGLLPAAVILSWGVSYSLASNGSLLTLSIPILTALVASMVREERMNLWRWLSFVLGMAGALISSDIDWSTLNVFGGRYLFGNTLILVGCLGNAFNNVYSKGLLERFRPIRLLVVSYLFTAILCVPLLVWFEPISWSDLQAFPWQAWFGVGILGLLTWGLGMIIWFRALVRLEATQVALSIYLLPFFGISLAALFLEEKITGSIIGGGILALASTTLILFADSRGSTRQEVEVVSETVP
jgi:drug/metabolite transporter (DMT)-like permease